jgi:crossover junction endodeoxyribonuclease RusA
VGSVPGGAGAGSAGARAMIHMTLPLPPSVNAYWRSVPATRNRRAMVLISQQGRAFKSRCRLLATMQCKTPLLGDVALTGIVYFKDKRRDLDNILKPLLDALCKVAYADDRQVARLTFERRYDAKNPRVELTIEPVKPA